MPAMKSSGTKQEGYEGLNPLMLLKGLLASYIMTIPAFMLFALILQMPIPTEAGHACRGGHYGLVRIDGAVR